MAAARAVPLLLLAMAPRPLPAAVCTPTDRVLWVGDSWSYIMWEDRILGDVMDQFGHGDKREFNDDPQPDGGCGAGCIDPNQTSIAGLTAQYAVDNDFMSKIQFELSAKPSLDIVLISLGGNDLIGGGWLMQGPAYDPNVSNELIKNQINTLAQAALSARPDVEVVVFGYDYVGLWEYVVRNISNLADPFVFLWVVQWGNPQPGAFYDDLVDLEARKKALCDANPRMTYINNLATAQYLHGHDTANIPGMFVQYPDATNFPQGLTNPLGGGRIGTDRFGQPVGAQLWAAANDWIHLSDGLYRQMCVNVLTQYLFAKFRGTPQLTIFSQGGLNDGYALGFAGSGSGSGTVIRMGDVSDGRNHRGIISFDTSSLPDGATVTGARIYVARSGIVGGNPFNGGASLGPPIVDVATGAFGNPQIENSDFQAPATATDVGCFAGRVAGNNYFLRVDITSAPGLAAINPVGLTQFRIYYPNADAGNDYINFHTGDAAAPLRPFLDLDYTLPAATPTSSATPPPSATPSPTPTPLPSATPTIGDSPSANPTPTPTASAEPSATPSPAATSSPPGCCPGDANNSGSFVDAADFIAVQANFGADNGLGGAGDADCSGSFVDAADFISVQANFGADCG